MKKRIEQSLNEFVPAALIFAAVFLLLRIYEFILLRGKLAADIDVAAIELGSLGYDAVFSFCVIAIASALHVALATVNQRLAYCFSTMLFTLLLIVNFCTIQYFAHTLVPLGLADFSAASFHVLILNHSNTTMDWTTITPLIVIIPLAIAGFFAIKDSMLVHHFSLTTIVLGALFFNLAWLLPMTPSPARFQHDVEYHMATNKTYFLLQDVFSNASHKASTLTFTGQQTP